MHPQRPPFGLRDNTHYRMDEIQKRHFEETADAAGMPKGTVDDIIAELEAVLPKALEDVEALADNTIPPRLIESITNGVRDRYTSLTMV